MTNGQIIGRLRKAAHVKQRELGDAVGLKSKGNFSEWEKGKVPMPDHWFRLCWEALSVLVVKHREEYEAALEELVAAGELEEA